MESALLSRDGLDMNDPANLALWTQIIVLMSSSEEVETLFQDPNPQQQRAIQNWAHSVGYDYEYTIANRTARVVKPAEIVPVNGLYHCPFEDDPKAECTHKPEKLKCNYDKFVDSHLKPYRCKISTCKDLCFSSTACLLRHERVTHAMHGYGDKPFLCTHEGCERAVPGNGFPRHWNLSDHMRRVHNDPIQRKDYKNARPLSPTSPHSGRARKMLGRLNGRRQSVHSQASSGYQEVVFDSGSSRLSSPGTPGRRGPLDAAARATMKAVKAVKACWRCKFLRKPCSEDNPCLRCPTKSANRKEKSWPAVGCNRGSFKDVLAPLQLCPRQNSDVITQDWAFHNQTLPYSIQEKMNEEYRAQLNARAEVLQKALNESTDSQPTTLNSYIKSFETENQDYKFLGLFEPSSLSPIPHLIRVAFTPLEECIAAVVYEAIRTSVSNPLRVDPFPQASPQMVKMLYSAARYQAKIDTDELIAQSIICLRSSFEAVGMMNYPLNWLAVAKHQLCKSDICQIDCIKTLDEHLSLYLDALSKVFFKKENMKNKETWWLSTFYSFAIQGLVRKLIRELSSTPESQAATDRYLHLAIRLFIASSSDYDPLMRDYVSSSKGKEKDSSYIADLEEAKTAVEQSSWASRNIFSSADYLSKLFENNGRYEMTENDLASLSSFSSELLPSGDESGEGDGGPWNGNTSLENGKKASRARRRILTPRSPRLARELKVSLADETSISPQASPWSSSYPAYSGSRPYRPSSLSSMESSSDIGAIPASPYLENTQSPQRIGVLDHDIPDYYRPSSIFDPENDPPTFSYLPPPSTSDEERKKNDIYADELYNPSFSINPEPSTSALNGEDSRSFDVFTQSLLAADKQNLPAIRSREQSPFRQGSPIPLGNDLSIHARFRTASQFREQRKAENDARALQEQLEPSSPEYLDPDDVGLHNSPPLRATKVSLQPSPSPPPAVPLPLISPDSSCGPPVGSDENVLSPKEVDLVYHESGDYADVRLFPVGQYPFSPLSRQQPSDLSSRNE